MAMILYYALKNSVKPRLMRRSWGIVKIMTEEEKVWRLICIGVWLGLSVEEIKENLEIDYERQVTPALVGLIEEVKTREEHI